MISCVVYITIELCSVASSKNDHIKFFLKLVHHTCKAICDKAMLFDVL